jgi:hypothetical protein
LAKHTLHMVQRATAHVQRARALASRLAGGVICIGCVAPPNAATGLKSARMAASPELQLFACIRDGVGAHRLECAVKSDDALQLLPTVASPVAQPTPTDTDLENNFGVLQRILRRYPDRIPTKREMERAFQLLDEQYGHRLSKADTRGRREAWASVDADTARWLLQHVWTLVRTPWRLSATKASQACAPVVTCLQPQTPSPTRLEHKAHADKHTSTQGTWPKHPRRKRCGNSGLYAELTPTYAELTPHDASLTPHRCLLRRGPEGTPSCACRNTRTRLHWGRLQNSSHATRRREHMLRL